ncbi:hypothetical protein N7509_010868 [Penicillium cosmopolitanum]|uniref:U1-type domain-containing protein n=1 Tax=Penicillium cosmopolitanum TaxID=1131564 RepID=A0A9X0B524_9EURO|nr:uncharacterized protein N7509_010868 [Penicillium cosmopolitanum]KAJ5388327.1 hypothetical protein N7509_010868 [Penicillium cosmopolitanum]
MAEYWKSAPRHWCKQCKIFIRDTPFEKTQHEASPKHQGSLKRFLRDIHKNNEIQQRDSQRARSEVERLRQAVGGGSSTAKDATPTHTAPPAPKPSDRSASIEDRKKQMSQLAEMGVSIPQEYRADMSLVGEWQTLSETNVAAEGLEGASKSIGVRKRKHEGDEEEGEVDEHAPGKTTSLGWGSKLRTYPGEQDGEDDDLDALLSSNKELKKPKITSADAESEEKKLKPPALVKQEDEVSESAAPEADKSSDAKTETPGVDSVAPKDERPPAEEATGFSFKKRKPKVMRK